MLKPQPEPQIKIKSFVDMQDTPVIGKGKFIPVSVVSESVKNSYNRYLCYS